MKQERLGQGCRCCGIMSPDVGHTTDGDLLCDRCDEHLSGVAGRLIWAGFIADRVCLSRQVDADREASQAAHLRHMTGELY